jgi:predicted nucleotidyltransferase component of viral defense system
MSIPEFNSFALVGGTALALRYGHRISIDLDLFSSDSFDNEKIMDVLEREFPGNRYTGRQNEIGVFAYIDDIKVDLVNYSRHPVIGKIEIEEGVRILSDKDLIAMKVNAILRRAVKKDFWDIAELLHHYSVQDLIDFYSSKYAKQLLLISIPTALTYFVDANDSDDPVSLKDQTWKSVQNFISNKINEFLK